MNAATPIRSVSRASLRLARSTHAQQTFRLCHPAIPVLRKPVAGPLSIRFHSTGPEAPDQPRVLTDRETNITQDAAKAAKDAIAERKAQEPAYEMTFTCKQCLERSSHRITKQAYHFGTVLVTCPGCKNRHLISDNMKIFSDKSITIEDILREKGQYIRKGSLGADGDVEFYEDPPAEDQEKPT